MPFTIFYSVFVLCLISPIFIGSQFLIPNGYIFILNLFFFNKSKFNLLFVFIASALNDLILNNYITLSAIKFLFVLYIFEFVIFYFKQNDLIVRCLLLNLLLMIIVYPSVDIFNYIKSWGGVNFFFNFILTYGFSVYLFYLLSNYCNEAKIGFCRIKVLCSGQN